MAVLYGASVFQEDRNGSDFSLDAIGKNSEAIAAGDPLTISTGILSVAGATSVVIGVAVQTATMAATNQTVAKVSPLYVPAQPGTIFLMGSNGDFTGNATDGGTYYKLTGTTGIVQVDQASGVQTTTSRIVEIVQVDPRGLGGTGSGSGLREVLVRFVKTPWLNVGGPA